MNTQPELLYSVCLWGSNPDLEDNDDCYTGADFATLEQARSCIADLSLHFNMVYYSDVPFIELDGPDVHEVIQRPGVRVKRTSDDNEWQREIANEAGMLGGCEAYNEAMGWD